MRFAPRVAAICLPPALAVMALAACEKNPTGPDKIDRAPGGCPAGYICGAVNPYRGVVKPNPTIAPTSVPTVPPVTATPSPGGPTSSPTIPPTPTITPGSQTFTFTG